MKPCLPRHFRRGAAHCPTPNAHPSPSPPSRLKINSDNVKTIRLNCNCIISCRIPLPLPPCGCAVARATRARSMLLCCRLHPREPCQHPAAGMGLTPSSPVLPPIAGSSQPLASSSCCSADGHLHGRDRWLQLSSTASSTQGAGTTPLKRAAVPDSICRGFGMHSSSLMRK